MGANKIGVERVPVYTIVSRDMVKISLLLDPETCVLCGFRIRADLIYSLLTFGHGWVGSNDLRYSLLIFGHGWVG